MNRLEVEKFIHQNFGGITQDYPWDDSPEYTVFRHPDNHKWFALIMTVTYSTLKIDRLGTVDILNLKSDPDLIEDLIKNPGIMPAYHMNKRHWATVLLDGSCPADRIKTLVDLSYQLTAKRLKRKRRT